MPGRKSSRRVVRRRRRPFYKRISVQELLESRTIGVVFILLVILGLYLLFGIIFNKPEPPPFEINNF